MIRQADSKYKLTSSEYEMLKIHCVDREQIEFVGANE